MARRRKLIRDFHKSGEGISRLERTTILEGKVKRDGVLTEDVELQTKDEEGTPYQQHATFVFQCASGHAIGEQVRIIGTCQHSKCERILCSTRGCAWGCRKCAKVFCRDHIKIFGSGQDVQVYCKRHSWLYWFKYWFGFGA